MTHLHKSYIVMLLASVSLLAPCTLSATEHTIASESDLKTLVGGSSLADQDVIKLTADITIGQYSNNTPSYTLGVSHGRITFDLNGHTLTANFANNPVFTIKSYSSVTFTDSQGGGKIYRSQTSSSWNYSLFYTSASDLIIEGGTYEIHNTGGSDQVSAIINSSNNSNTNDEWAERCVRISGDNTQIIVSHTAGTASAIRFGGDVNHTNITGGRFNVTGTTAAYAIYLPVLNNDYRGSINVTGGYFKTTATNVASLSINEVLNEDASFSISGGFFSNQTGIGQYLSGGKCLIQLSKTTAQSNGGYYYQIMDIPATTVCMANGVAFNTVEAALAYAAQNAATNMTILLLQDYTMSTPGTYSIPANATLLVPYKPEQTSAIGTISDKVGTSYVAPTCYRKLTLNNGVNLHVYGVLEASAQQYFNGQGQTGVCGAPGGGYGHIVIKEGSNISIENGGKLIAWGYISGSYVNSNYTTGTIDAKRGGKVYEGFQFFDFKGGTNTWNIAVTSEQNKVFPVQQYGLQNIESPVKYRPGSRLFATAGIGYSAQMVFPADNVPIVGIYEASQGNMQPMFFMDDNDDSEDTWIRVDYDPSTDILHVDVNNAASIGAINLMVMGMQVSSANMVLPITNNMHIRLLSGLMHVTQDANFFPGSELEIDKQATVQIDDTVTVYFWDAAQWGYYGFDASSSYNVNAANLAAATFTANVRLLNTARFSPNWPNGINPRAALSNLQNNVITVASANPETITERFGLESAKLNVHGTFEVYGNLQTTSWSSENNDGTGISDFSNMNNGTASLSDGINHRASQGANIFSTNADAGTIRFANNATAEGSVYTWGVLDNFTFQVQSVDNTGKVTGTTTMQGFRKRVTTSALLRNSDGSTTATINAQAGDTYSYFDNQWRCWETEGCFQVDKRTDLNNYTWYAKPGDYVAVASTGTTAPIPNSEHVYQLAIADNDSALILLDDCQWWKVGQVPEDQDLWHCRKNNIYYYYDDAEGKWKEKTFNVSWYNYNGEQLTYTYIDEWDDEITEPIVYTNVKYGTHAQFFHTTPTREADEYYTYSFSGWSPNPAQTIITADASFTATYTATPKVYNITFIDQSSNVTIMQVNAGETPVPPTYDDQLYQWSPTLQAATADASYTLIAKKQDNFTIEYVNYDGTSLQLFENVTLNATMPAYTGSTPAKSPLQDKTYTFTGWQPTYNPSEQVTADRVFVATFTETPVQYTITVESNNDSYGTVTGGGTFGYGEVISISATPNQHYKLDYWNDNITANERSIMVTKNETYTAHFTLCDQYTITVLAENDSYGTVSGNGTFYEGETAQISASAKPGYLFKCWSDGNTSDTRTVTVTKNRTYTATFYTPYVYTLHSGYNAFYSSEANYQLSSGQAYRAELNENTTNPGELVVELYPIGSIIPQSTGVIIYSPSESTITLTPTADYALLTERNDLKGTDTGISAASLAGTIYILGKDNNGIGFFPYTGAIPDHYSYLQLISGNNAPTRLRFSFGNQVPTDATTIEQSDTMQGIYTITGIKLAEPIHGTLNIINGKLVFVP